MMKQFYQTLQPVPNISKHFHFETLAQKYLEFFVKIFPGKCLDISEKAINTNSLKAAACARQSAIINDQYNLNQQLS